MTTTEKTKCTVCGSGNIQKAGFSWRDHNRVQRYRCKDCGRIFTPRKKEA